MNVAIYLNNKCGSVAIEIDNKSRDDLLPPKTDS